jgi:hypothetical protein
MWFTAPTIQETSVPVNRRDPMTPRRVRPEFDDARRRSAGKILKELLQAQPRGTIILPLMR